MGRLENFGLRVLMNNSNSSVPTDPLVELLWSWLGFLS